MNITPERQMIATRLIGGVADGDEVAVLSDSQAVSLSRLGNGWAVYYLCPDGRYRFVDVSARPVGQVIE